MTHSLPTDRDPTDAEWQDFLDRLDPAPGPPLGVPGGAGGGPDGGAPADAPADAAPPDAATGAAAGEPPRPAAWQRHLAANASQDDVLSTTPEGVPVPVFTPWLGERRRARGWSPVTQRAFIVALTRIGSARAAAKAVGRSVRSAYALKGRDGAESFAAAWDTALLAGVEGAQQAAISRALHGELVPVFKDGVCTGHRLQHNDRLLVATLGSGMRMGVGARRRAALDGYRDLLERWEWALNRRTMRLAAGGQFPEERRAEAIDAHRIWEQEIKAEQRRAYRADVRARLRAATRREAEARAAAAVGPRIRRL